MVPLTPCGARSVFASTPPPRRWQSGGVTAISAVPPALAELAAECGVATGYTDAHGVHRDVSEHTLRAVLAAMGVGDGPGHDDDHDNRNDNDNDNDDDNNTDTDTDTDEASTDAAPTTADASDRELLEEARLRSWRRVLPPTVVTRQGTPTPVSLHIPFGAEVEIRAHLEDGGRPLTLLPLAGTRVQQQVDGITMEQATVTVPGDIPSGWHRLVVVVDPVTAPTHPGRTVEHSGRTVEATLLIAPTAIALPAGLDERRAVGLSAQLYQVRSADSWGVGDLADLGRLAEWGSRDLGADFVLVNPMHASEPFPPVSPSPYLPTTRRFVSPLYLRPERVPEYAQLTGSDRARVDDLARSAAAGNSADTIDRDAAWTAKLEALRLLFAVTPSPGRQSEFDQFTRDEEPGLHSFATWCVLAGQHGPDWIRWPEDLRDPESPAVAAFAEKNADEVRFHKWLQWLTTEQRASAQRAASAAGMRLGVIHDLAVGVHPTGADAWTLSRSLARGVSVGAPPDIYNQRGQDWSQPPLRPDALAENGYRAFRDIARAALRDAGGVRIDHILGLFRLWWIPAGAPPTEGTYVHYDTEAMLAVLTLEASRAGAVVIGEDLGTVAPGMRESLAERGVLGTSVMWFENHDGAPTDPEQYRRLCMASVTTHDLVPTAGYTELVHVDIRDQLGQLTRDVEEERDDAASEVAGFVAAVRDLGLLEGDSPVELVAALHGFVAAAPSVLFAVSVADLVADRRPVNMPGTSTEYPNWSVPITDGDGRVVGLEELMDSSGPGRVFDAISRRREV